MQILRCAENYSPPQREEGLGVVGGIVSERQPPLTPPYQGGESFSCTAVSRRIIQSSRRMTHGLFKKRLRLVSQIVEFSPYAIDWL
jgi:hypothetical protein